MPKNNFDGGRREFFSFQSAPDEDGDLQMLQSLFKSKDTLTPEQFEQYQALLNKTLPSLAGQSGPAWEKKPASSSLYARLDEDTLVALRRFGLTPQSSETGRSDISDQQLKKEGWVAHFKKSKEDPLPPPETNI